MAAKQFKVILAGGSFPSLALANMLEKFEIDYVILESYEEIALPVGAIMTIPYCSSTDNGYYKSCMIGPNTRTESFSRRSSEFIGRQVVGTNGIHSIVRSEIFRLGQELEPGYFPAGEEAKKCNIVVTGKDTSQLVVSGPESRLYWFLFVKRSATQYGKNIPKFTKDDEADCVKEHVNLPVTDEIMFGQIYAKRLTSALTPLHEVVYKKWFFRRVMVLGETSCKPNLIRGQGEKKEGGRMGLVGLKDTGMTDIFSQTQAARNDRARQIVDTGHQQQTLFVFENPLVSHLLLNVASRFMGDEFMLSQIAGVLADSGAIMMNCPRIQSKKTHIKRWEGLLCVGYGDSCSAYW
ncbi:putative FAD binding domain protein [Seiridium unicorne]|uniref:FAD binding domain protein n=1 Tax=Seiridium unicorne TaxID=138068 RepID=A0ABR2UVY4_9PEZI